MAKYFIRKQVEGQEKMSNNNILLGEISNPMDPKRGLIVGCGINISQNYLCHS